MIYKGTTFNMPDEGYIYASFTQSGVGTLTFKGKLAHSLLYLQKFRDLNYSQQCDILRNICMKLETKIEDDK